MNARKRGRPTAPESVDIAKTIEDLFLQGASPGFIIQKTGFDKNTVYRKYNELLSIVKEQNEKDFRENYEQKKIQFVVSIEDLIWKTCKILNYTELRMEKYMRRKKDIPEPLLHRFSDLTKNLVAMQKEKAAKNIKIPIAKEIEDAITEEVEKSVR